MAAGMDMEAAKRVKDFCCWEAEYALRLTLNESQLDLQNHTWRTKISFWFLQVAVDCNFCRETVSCAMNYLMRYTTVIPRENLTLEKFQLAAITSIFIASKVEESSPLTIAKMRQLSDSHFLEEDFLSMERSLLQVLEGRLNPPTPYHFLQAIRGLVSSEIAEFAEGCIDMFHHETSFQLFLPSDVAFAAVLCAFKNTNVTFSKDKTMLWLGTVWAQISPNKCRSFKTALNCFERISSLLKTQRHLQP